MRLIYHAEAEAELAEAATFYERRVPGLGGRFRDEFESCIARILETPNRWRILEGDIRLLAMKLFPYSVLYRVEGEVLRVLVLKHHRRHPDYWKSRLAG